VENFFAFLVQEWLLVATLAVLAYLYYWRERIKSGELLSPSHVSQRLNQGNALLIDLRDSAEYKAGHIVGAINIGYSKLLTDTNDLATHKGKTIILADKLGQHAGTIGRKLGREGFTVCRLNGGIAEWQAQNLPLVKGNK